MKTLVLVLLLGGIVQAQTTDGDHYVYTRKEPTSLFLVAVGVVVAFGGVVILAQRDPCCCFPQPTPYQLTGGVVALGTGIGLVAIGTRTRWVTRVVPSVTHQSVGVSTVIRWRPR
jgi:hypothetical protein